MIIKDNSGNIIGELNTSVTSDGKVINTNTIINNGRVVSQHVSIRNPDGTSESKNIIGGKILP